MPIPGGFDNRLEVRVLWSPAQDFSCKRRIGNQFRWITGTAVGDDRRDFVIGYLAAAFDHFFDTLPALGSQVDFDTVALSDPFQCGQVCRAEIVDVDVVTNAGLVAGRPIIAENRNRLSLAECHLQHDGDQMRFRIVVLSDVSLGRSSGSVEIPQRSVTKIIGMRVVSQRALDDQLGETVRIDRRLFLRLADRNRFRDAVSGTGAGKNRVSLSRPVGG